MYRSNRKRIAALILAGALFLTSCSGCSPSSETSSSLGSSETSAGTSETASTTETETNEEVTVSMFLMDSVDQAISPDLPIIKEITERTGINFEFIPGPATEDQFREKFNVTVASGNIPDIMVSNYRDDMLKVAEQGLFAPLDELISTSCPNFQAILDEHPEYIRDLRATDGQIYFFPFIGAVHTLKTWMVRKDWLDKLDLPIPETTDDWYNMLKAFKENDPNGNGEADEIPFTTRHTEAGILSFMEAWGLSGFEVTEQFYLDGDEVKYAYIEPRFKEALEYMNKLYSEGLVDPEYATNDTNVWMSRMTTEVSGACQDTVARAYSLETSILAANPESDVEFVVVPPPKGPYGDQMTTSQMNSIRGYTAISAKSENKEAIAKLFDYFYSEEGSLLNNFGVEGLTYEMVDGSPVYTDAVAKDPQGRALLSMLNIYGHREWAYQQDIGYEDALLPDQRFVDYRNDMEQYIAPNVPALSFTDDEREIINSFLTEITTYKDEAVSNFIMGRQSLDKFDSFVETIKSMGIDQVLEVEQAAYDRYME